MAALAVVAVAWSGQLLAAEDSAGQSAQWTSARQKVVTSNSGDTKLKWRAHKPSQSNGEAAPAKDEQAGAEKAGDEKARREDHQVQRAVALSGRTTKQSSRAKLRDEILQVSSESETDAELDPFNEGIQRAPSDVDPLGDSTATPDTMPEDPTIEVPSAEDAPIDEPSRRTRPYTEAMPIPSGIVDESPNLDRSAGKDCNQDKKDCIADFKLLKANVISKISLDINVTGAEGEDYPCQCEPRAGVEVFEGRHWCQTIYTWKASGLCHKPLYFEDVHLERYGHSWNPVVQPFMSAAHFFVSVPILPYKMGLQTPNECVYTLGYYRPGDCAPYLIDPFPFSVRGALFQGAAVAGVAAIIP